jgi:hypothetical protein
MNVVMLPLPVPVPAPINARLRRIGRVVAVGSLLITAAIVFSIPVVWSSDQLIQRWLAWQSPLGVRPITVRFDTRLVGGLISLLGAIPVLFALVELAKLFAAFARGSVFEDANARRIGRIGWALIVKAAVSPFLQILTTYNLTRSNPPDLRMIGFELELGQLLTLLAGIALIAFARIMREAVQLSTENSEFV